MVASAAALAALHAASMSQRNSLLRRIASAPAPASTLSLSLSLSLSMRRQLSSLAQVPASRPPSTATPPPSTQASVPTRRERRLVKKTQRKEAKRRVASSSISARLGMSTKTLSPFVRKDRQFKTYKPITRSIRWLRQPLNEHLWKGKPEKSLTIAKRGTGGRNHHGHVTVRGRGGGHRRRLRLVDFYRWEAGQQTVLRIEYDPGRSAHIALVEHNESKRRSYILAPDGLREGDTVQSYRSSLPKTAVNVDPAAPQSTTPPSSSSSSSSSASLDLGIFRTQAIRPGNFLPLHLIPIGTTIHAITLNPRGPAKLVRSAGTNGQLVSFSARKGAGDSYAQVRLQSGEVRLVPSTCCAAIGTVSNKDHQHARLGKAGRSRWLGRRPKVRGVAMNAYVPFFPFPFPCLLSLLVLGSDRSGSFLFLARLQMRSPARWWTRQVKVEYGELTSFRDRPCWRIQTGD